MKIEEWLNDLEYDSDGMFITKHINGGSVKVLDIRGWSTIVNSLGSERKAALFQDEVGKFVLEAINEKLENDKEKDRIWKVIQAMLPPIDEETRIKIEKQLSKEPYGNTNN